MPCPQVCSDSGDAGITFEKSKIVNQTQFHSFTHALVHRLEADDRVLALVAIGSLAQSERVDAWSDHDFWVIATAAAQTELLTDLSWLPDAPEIALTLRPAPQYYTVLYKSGHIAEFAVFTPQELTRGRLTHYRMLFDKAEIAPQIQTIATAVQQEQQQAYDASATFSHFLITLCTGAGRAARGEWLSAHTYIFQYAVDALLTLITHHIPSEESTDSGDLFDPRRRFEQRYPELSTKISPLFLQPPAIAARHLLDLAEQLFAEDTIMRAPQALPTARAYLKTLVTQREA
jgi:hypothetical protein